MKQNSFASYVLVGLGMFGSGYYFLHVVFGVV